MLRNVTLAAAFAGLTFTATGAVAGSSQNGPGNLPIHVAEAFSDQIQLGLAAKGAHVAIVARAGRDPADLPKGVNFTHVGLWVLSDITDDRGDTYRGYRVWNLYQNADNPGRSSLVVDRPVDFVAGAKTPEVGIIIPAPELQRRLVKVLNSPGYGGLHNPNYSVLSNPKNNVYQNCTEHLMNVVMAAIYETYDMEEIKANMAAYFPGHPVRLDPFSGAFGPAFVAGVEVDDHEGAIRTATFGSIARFLERYDMAKETYRLKPQSS